MCRILKNLYNLFLNHRPQSSEFKIILFDHNCYHIPDQNRLIFNFTPPFLGSNLKIKNTRLRLSLYHDWLPDLNIRLLHRDCSIPLLNSPFPPYEDCCGSFNDWLQTSAFNGIDVYGDWAIIIEDNGPDDTGELYCVELELTVSSKTKDVAINYSSNDGKISLVGKKIKNQSKRR